MLHQSPGGAGAGAAGDPDLMGCRTVGVTHPHASVIVDLVSELGHLPGPSIPSVNCEWKLGDGNKGPNLAPRRLIFRGQIQAL